MKRLEVKYAMLKYLIHMVMSSELKQKLYRKNTPKTIRLNFKDCMHKCFKQNPFHLHEKLLF